MNPKVKSIIQIIFSLTLGVIMFMSIFMYFYSGYVGEPLYIIIKYIFAALIINSIGLIVLANLATINERIKPILHFYLGFYLSIFLIIGFLKNTFNSPNEAYFALAIGIFISYMVIMYFKNSEMSNWFTTVFMSFIFVLFTVVGFLTTPESVTIIQKNQSIFALTSLAALISLFDPVRQGIKKYLKADFDNPISMTALFLSILLLGFSVYVILVFKDLGGFVNFASQGAGSIATPSLAIYQLLYFIGVAFIGVGLFFRRKFLDVLKRLGLVVPKGKDYLYIIVFVIALYIVDLVFSYMGVKFGLVDAIGQKNANEVIFQNFNSFPLMLLLAIAAGVGEEILFRGALQPKFGIIVTTLIFTLLHGQYDVFGLITVFVLGLILSYQRKLSNTTSVIISHFLYDLIGLAIIFLIK